MEYTPDRFESICISDLIRLEEWLHEYSRKEFRGQNRTFVTKDELPKYDDIQKKIKDIEEAILIRITDMQKKSFGGDIYEV